MRYARVRSLRRTVALSGLVIAALVIGGCSNNDTATESSSSDFETVTIESALGNAVITEKPERIVTLAPWSGITQQQFDSLNAFAPTVAYAESAWTITWEEQINVIGKAMGESEKATAEIDKIKSQFAESTAAHPNYADVSFSFIYNTGPGTLGVFFAEEQRVAMVRALGLQVDPVVYTLTESEGTDSAVIGLENANLLDKSDLLFTFYSDPANRAEIEAQPAYKAIPAVARGTVIAPTEQPFVTGSSMINPLTVPWSLERYVPMIDEAIAKLNK
jgi:iron complex transport system substrate-binding protein